MSAGPLAWALRAAGRDLLRTHFATSPDGAWLQQSDWSAVISSVPVTRAVAAEAASWSRELALLMSRLLLAAETGAAVPAAVQHALAGGCQWLLTASAAVTAGHRFDLVTKADAELLHAIPVNAAALQRPPDAGEKAAELAGGVAASGAAAGGHPGNGGAGGLVPGDDRRIVAVDGHRRRGHLPRQPAPWAAR